MSAAARALVRGLLHEPGDSAIRAAIRARGDVAAYLIELLTDRALWEEDRSGPTSLAAATLLGEVRTVEAIDPLVAVLRELHPMQPLFSAVVFALREMGPPAAEPVLALALAAERDPRAFPDADGVIGGCVEVLTTIARGNERVFELVCRWVRHWPAMASFLADLEDPRGLEVLHEVAAAFRVDLLEKEAWIELYGAIERLGTPTAAEREKNDTVLARRRRR